MNKMKKFWLPDLLIVLAGILLDQFTKYLAVIYLKGQEAVSLIPGSIGTEISGKPRRSLWHDAGRKNIFPDHHADYSGCTDCP